jgi:site-specific recombinase XerC
MFCLAEARALAPVTEQQLVAYVGWLAQERDAGRRSVSAGSLPQYLTAARTVASSLFDGDTETTTMPLLGALQRAYSKLEAIKYPSLTHRGGVPADIVKAIWSHAVQSQVRNDFRDGTAVVLGYVLGLRESSLLSLPAEGVTWDEHKVTAQVVVVKGKKRGIRFRAFISAVLQTYLPLLIWWHNRAV